MSASQREVRPYQGSLPLDISLQKVMVTLRGLPASCSQQIFYGLGSSSKTFVPASVDHKIGAVALA